LRPVAQPSPAGVYTDKGACVNDREEFRTAEAAVPHALEKEEKPMMRRICFPVGLAFLLLAASVNAAEPQRLTAKFDKTPLADVIAFVRTGAGMAIDADDNLVKTAAPVTGTFENVGLDAFLYEVLRPRGMEFIHVGDNKIEVVSQASQPGATKAAGRSLLTFVSLEAKLEQAKAEGNEVRVPEWTEADDHELIRAVTDFVGAIAYTEALGRYEAAEATPEDIIAYIKHPDPAVRVGTALTFVANRHIRSALRDAAKGERIGRALLVMAKDANPGVRGSAVVTLLVSRLSRNPSLAESVKDTFISASKDRSREVRFAAALGVVESRNLVDEGAYARLRNDSEAAVRVTSNIASMIRHRRDGGGKGYETALKAMLKDDNPVARAILLGMASTMNRGQEGVDLTALVAENGDPWLNLCSGVFVPISKREMATATPTMADLLKSGKPSHETLGAFGAMMSVTFGRLGRRGQEAPPFDLGAAAQSKKLWVRLPVIFLARATGAADAEARLLAAARSESEPDRLVALLSLAGRRQEPVSPALREEVRKAMSRPVFAEQALAASIAGHALGLDGAVSLLKQRIAEAPDASSTRLLLSGMRRLQYSVNDEDREALLAKVGDVVLATPDAKLQQTYVSTFLSTLTRGVEGKYAALETFVQKAEPEALAVLLSQRYGRHRIGRTGLLGTIAARLDGIFKKGDAATKLKAAEQLRPRRPTPLRRQRTWSMPA